MPIWCVIKSLENHVIEKLKMELTKCFNEKET